MKQFNDITIIGIDQGYGNMKTANTIFPTAITAYDTAPMFKGDVLEYGGRFYRVGEGHKGFVADKSEDGDFYLLTLAAIAKELEQYRLFTANLCLAVGLPLSWVGSQRESFRQYLMQNETVSFRFNGNLFQLRIVSCKVYPQGYAAIVQQLADFEGENTIQPEDVDAVHQQRIALRPIIAIERERTLYRESRVDDTAISLAEKIVDTEIENVYSTPKQQNISQSHNEKFR